jgi:hypothetical protein
MPLVKMLRIIFRRSAFSQWDHRVIRPKSKELLTRSFTHFIKTAQIAVAVVQLVEHQIVILGVVGSRPISHPI